MSTLPFQFSNVSITNGSLKVDVLTEPGVTNFDLTLVFQTGKVLLGQSDIRMEVYNGWTVVNSATNDKLMLSGYSLVESTVNQKLLSLSFELADPMSRSLSFELFGEYNDPGLPVLSSVQTLKPLTLALSGVALDGYISGASIYLDANNNGIADPLENTGLTTDSLGRFSGTVVGEGALIAIGGTNIDTGLINTLTLAAPNAARVISPLTTLIQGVVKATNISTSDASAAVSKVLGLSSSVDLLQFDPISSAENSAAIAIQKANVQVAMTVSLAGSEVIGAITNEIIALKTSETKLDLSQAASLTRLAPEISASSIQSLSVANSSIQSKSSMSDIALTQKLALLSSGRAGSEADDTLKGDAGDDLLSAGRGKDRLQGGGGSDSLDGGDGIDTAIFEKARSAYRTEKLTQGNITIWKVTDLVTGDVDELRNIEKLEFAKSSVTGYQNLVQTEVNLDVTGTPAVTYRLYRAAFARDPDLGGLGYWISALEQYLNPNLSPEQNPFLLDVAKSFVESPEFKAKYGADVDNATYIRNLYKNALGRDPLIPDPITGKTDAGYTYWVGVLDAKAASRSDLFVYFSESTENKAAVAPIIATGVEYVPWVPPGG